MKILHLSATKNWGGGENHIENLCYELRNSPDIENYILCAKNGVFHSRLKNMKIPFFVAPLSNKMDPRFLLKLKQTCEKEAIDLIHIHDTTALTLAVMADKIWELPPFIFSKKTSFPIRKRKRTLFKYNYPKIKKVFCVSEVTKTISSKYIEEKDKLSIIYHGTRMDNKSNKTPFLLREKYKLPKNKIIIGHIANHLWYKDLETFINTINLLINTKKQTRLHFVQIGAFSNLTPALIKKIEKLNLKEHITFLGFVPNASNFIPQFDLTLITSESEGIPQVIYESFYHEVPVISTKVGGIQEVIENGKNGLLAEAFDYETLAKNILTLERNKELQEIFTAKSKEKLSNFTTKIMAEKTLAEYKKVLDGRL